MRNSQTLHYHGQRAVNCFEPIKLNGRLRLCIVSACISSHLHQIYAVTKPFFIYYKYSSLCERIRMHLLYWIPLASLARSLSPIQRDKHSHKFDSRLEYHGDYNFMNHIVLLSCFELFVVTIVAVVVVITAELYLSCFIHFIFHWLVLCWSLLFCYWCIAHMERWEYSTNNIATKCKHKM